MIAVYMLLAAVIGYFCGAIPFGFIYVKLATGQDVRQIGSGRVGGTNSMRAAGWKVGFATAMSDVFKGALAIWIVNWLWAGPVSAADMPLLHISAGVLVVIGHNWSVFMGFKGGAGTGPNIGWAAVIWFPMFPVGFTVMLGLIYFLGIASVASMTMALVIPIGFGVLYFTNNPVLEPMTPIYMVGGIITAAIVAFALRGNFQRLLRGEERIVGLRAQLRKRRERQQAGGG
ncbi:MAG: glycerol-3-phosphate acyltransferase [Chloroflexi bacterium]|nr:glycerol-3-phosphate acyltransferase [Chloroflexota bacterium]